MSSLSDLPQDIWIHTVGFLDPKTCTQFTRSNRQARQAVRSVADQSFRDRAAYAERHGFNWDKSVPPAFPLQKLHEINTSLIPEGASSDVLGSNTLKKEDFKKLQEADSEAKFKKFQDSAHELLNIDIPNREYLVAILPTLPDAKKEVLLGSAAETGCSEAVFDLIKAKANVNTRRGWRESTPLHLAVAGGHIDVIRALCEHGADMQIPDERGCFALHHVRDVRTWRVLTEYGANVNTASNSGYLPLHYAATADNTEAKAPLIRELIRQGADVNIRETLFNRSTLHLATQNNRNQKNIDAVEALIEAGADLDAQDNQGRTPLHNALQEGSADIAKVLLQRGASANIQDVDNRLPLHILFDSIWRFEDGKVDSASMMHILLLLIRKTNDIDARDLLGNTPLHIAVRLQLVNALMPLLAGGADLNAQNSEGKTPFDCLETSLCSSNEKASEIREILVAAGAERHRLRNIKENIDWNIALARVRLERRCTIL